MAATEGVRVVEFYSGIGGMHFAIQSKTIYQPSKKFSFCMHLFNPNLLPKASYFVMRKVSE